MTYSGVILRKQKGGAFSPTFTYSFYFTYLLVPSWVTILVIDKVFIY